MTTVYLCELFRDNGVDDAELVSTLGVAATIAGAHALILSNHPHARRSVEHGYSIYDRDGNDLDFTATFTPYELWP